MITPGSCFSGTTPDIFGLGDSYYLDEHSTKGYSGIQKSNIFEKWPGTTADIFGLCDICETANVQ